jgi:hypothetical protein
MLFRRLKKFGGSLVLASVPTSARLAEVSQSLAEKYDAQVKWMREKGITGTLDETRDREPERSVPAALMRRKNSKN